MQTRIIVGCLLFFYFALNGHSYAQDSSYVNQAVDMEINILKSVINLTDDEIVAIKPIFIEYDNKINSLNAQRGMDNRTKRIQTYQLDDQKMQQLGKILTPDQMNYLLNQKMTNNEAYVKASLHSVSTAAESYAASNGGHYPSSINDLTDAKPPYITQVDCDTTISEYVFTCNFNPNGYTIQAVPVTIGTTGSKTFTIKTGGALTSN